MNRDRVATLHPRIQDSGENVGDRPIHVIVIELKGSPAAGSSPFPKGDDVSAD